ncbi:MAG: diguanylate cyclase [Mariprofundales bacterium]|nr:diguanylate cyclase [Mariprofundales bacterium]
MSDVHPLAMWSAAELPVTVLVEGMDETALVDLEQQWPPESQVELVRCAVGENPQKIAAHRGVTVVVQTVASEDLSAEEFALQAIRAYRTSAICCDIPLVALVPSVEGDLPTRLLQAGADAVLTLPMDALQLLVQMRALSRIYFDRIELESLRQALHKTRKQLKAARIELQQREEMDPLTGLMSTPRFAQAYDAEWQRAMRETNPIAVLLLEVDCFDGYLNRYGRQVADDCLRQLARLLLGCLSRTSDVVARTGDASFVILMPNTPAAGGIKVGAKVHHAIEALRLVNEASSVDSRVTVSLGLATTSPMVRHTAQMLQLAAAKALANARNQGGNQLACEAI